MTDRAAEGWLAFDVDSHDIPPSEATGVGKSYQSIGNAGRETSYFLNMYLRDTRAIDYIASRPDWDGKTIVVTGTSMGGQQSLAAAGLNPKITAVIVNEPAGADSNGDLHGRKAGYPNWPSDNPKVMETALYFDIVNFASRIKAPVLAALGFIDTIAPPAGIWIALNQIPGSFHGRIRPQQHNAPNARRLQLSLQGSAGPDSEWWRIQAQITIVAMCHGVPQAISAPEIPYLSDNQSRGADTLCLRRRESSRRSFILYVRRISLMFKAGIETSLDAAA